MKTFAIDTNLLIYAHNKNSPLHQEVTSRKQIFDVAIAAILKDNNVFGIDTVNVKDFDNFSFLEVINPLV